MIDKETAYEVANYWRQFNSPAQTQAQRLEAALPAVKLMMTALINGLDSVQRYSDSTALVTAILSAGAGEAIGESGTITKESWVEYQTLFLSFRQWLNTPTSALLPTGTLDENDEPITFLSELAKSPATLIAEQPGRVAE